MRKQKWNERAASVRAESAFESALYGESESDRKTFNPSDDRKTLQLCRQAERALSLALAGECGDELLREASIAGVVPMGGASQLLVRVLVSTQSLEMIALVSERLNAKAPRLRALVAQSVSRKKAPGLAFVVLPSASVRGGCNE